MSEAMQVSVVIPAYNAAETIGETLRSLQDQTFTDWEAIVVDDGSVDETAVVVTQFSGEDGRIKLVQQPNQGGSAARNTGLQQARNKWLLFLDADDWLLPSHLEKMTAALKADESLDAVHCGWARVNSAGERGRVDFAPDLPDLFPTFAHECAFLIHTCLVRRVQAEAVGGFDVSLSSCQDWDFWQRIARNQTKFGGVRELLALYRSRPGSVSLHGKRQLVDSLRVIGQAYRSDARVPNPSPIYADGLPDDDLALARIHFACWSFGLILGAGEDARPHLTLLEGDRYTELDPAYVAACFAEAGLLPQGLAASGWDTLWPQIAQNVKLFLPELEALTGTDELAPRTLAHLEAEIIKRSKRERPFSVGQTYAVAVEVTQPLPQIRLDKGIERVNAAALLEGEWLGSFQLTASQASSLETLAERIAAAYAWPILGRYFAYHIFPRLRVVRQGERVSIWRDDVWLTTLAIAAAPDETAFWAAAHDEVGWTLLLQEIWRRPYWPHAYFYDVHLIEAAAPFHKRTNGTFALRLGASIPDIITESEKLEASLQVGDRTLTSASIETMDGGVHAHVLRVVLTEAAGYDLCPAVVQAVLLGRPMASIGSLADELQALGNGRISARRKIVERDYVKFIILAQERTGSIYLQGLLDSHPQIHCVGEVFNQSLAIRQTIKKLSRPIQSNENPLDYLADVVFREYDDDIRAVGFRFFYDHARDRAWRGIWRELRDAGIRVIHLRRRNLLDRYLSLQLARRSNIWRTEKKVDRAYDEPIILDPSACFDDIYQSQWKGADRAAFFKDSPSIDLFYESLAADVAGESKRLLDFIGVSWQPLTTGTRKQRARSKPDIIANYDQLRQFVMKRQGEDWVKAEWLTYFDDE